MIRTRTQFRFTVIALLASTASLADTITIRADAWCPFNCAATDPNPGFMIEIAKAVFEKAGHHIDYATMPWARAISDTREEKYNAIVGAYKDDAPDFIFPKNEQGRASNRLYVNKDEKWRYHGLKSLDGAKIGVITDYAYDKLTNKLIKSKHPSFDVLSGDDVLDRMFKMVLSHRLTAFYEDPNVAMYNLRKQGLVDKFKDIGAIQQRNEPVYIAFSPKIKSSKSYADILSDGIKELRKTGELAKILTRYDMKDWQK